MLYILVATWVVHYACETESPMPQLCIFFLLINFLMGKVYGIKPPKHLQVQITQQCLKQWAGSVWVIVAVILCEVQLLRIWTCCVQAGKTWAHRKWCKTAAWPGGWGRVALCVLLLPVFSCGWLFSAITQEPRDKACGWLLQGLWINQCVGAEGGTIRCCTAERRPASRLLTGLLMVNICSALCHNVRHLQGQEQEWTLARTKNELGRLLSHAWWETGSRWWARRCSEDKMSDANTRHVEIRILSSVVFFDNLVLLSDHLLVV